MKLLPNSVITLHVVNNIKWLENTICLLKKTYNVVPLSDIAEYFKGGILKNSCHLTFDDGDLSFYNNVFPLIKKHKVPVSIYISPRIAKEKINYWFQEIQGYEPFKLKSIIKEDFAYKDLNLELYPVEALLKQMKLESILHVIERYQEEHNVPQKKFMNMTVDQVMELKRSRLVAVGAHTLYHPILANESDEVSRYEIVNSIIELSELLDEKITSFAFPNGKVGLDFGQREIGTLKSSGVLVAFSTENRNIKITDSPLNIPRKEIHYGSSTRIIFKMLRDYRYDSIKKRIKGMGEEDYREEIRQLLQLNISSNL